MKGIRDFKRERYLLWRSIAREQGIPYESLDFSEEDSEIRSECFPSVAFQSSTEDYEIKT